jgi:hypothetical protein
MKTPLLLLLLAAGCLHAAPVSATIKAIPPGPQKILTRDSGDVIVTDGDGSRAAWTKDTRCLLPRVSKATGRVGWTTGKITATKQNGTTLVNNTLRIAANKNIIATLTDPLMIEDWGFHEDGQSVVVKSRGFHGPATIYRATIATGKVTASHKAFAPNLPAWAQPFSDADAPAPAAPADSGDQKPHTPKIGSPERKAILDALRREVAAEQKREDPDHKYAPAVFTPSHFNVIHPWAFVDTTMKPDYGEQNSVIAVLREVEGDWAIAFTSYADDVTNYDKLAKKLKAPRSLFPRQAGLDKLGE